MNNRKNRQRAPTKVTYSLKTKKRITYNNKHAILFFILWCKQSLNFSIYFKLETTQPSDNTSLRRSNKNRKLGQKINEETFFKTYIALQKAAQLKQKDNIQKFYLTCSNKLHRIKKIFLNLLSP